MPKLPSEIKKVGVFVDSEIEKVIETVSNYGLDAVQLHGNESAEYCKKLDIELKVISNVPISIGSEKSKGIPQSLRSLGNDSKIEIIKVFSIKNEFDFSILKEYEEVCDYFLFDTKGKLPGGNGYTFDWAVLKDYPSTKPYFLSGGIGLENTEDIEAFLKQPESKYCHALDINSKFEDEPGLKNIKKIEEFISKLSPLERGD